MFFISSKGAIPFIISFKSYSKMSGEDSSSPLITGKSLYYLMVKYFSGTSMEVEPMKWPGSPMM